jgi:uncharacterized Zn ribbon protein
MKDLKVKGSSAVLKRGTLIKNIRLTDDPTEIDCRAEKVNEQCCVRNSKGRGSGPVKLD